MDNIKIGIDLGGSHVSVGVVNCKYQIIEQYEKDFTIEEKKDLMNIAIEFIVDTLNSLKDKYSFFEFRIGNGWNYRKWNCNSISQYWNKKF